MAGGSGGRSAFRGSGYTLGGDETESRKVEDPNEPLRRLLAQRPQEVKRVLKLWRNGFSVDDGPLYRFDDPANKAYLEQINNGRAPLEVLNVEYGQPVTVHVEKRSDEDYTPPPKTHKPFEGKGHRLGAEIPPRPEPVNPPTSAAEPTSAGSKTKTPQADVDESKPTTTVQVRMASGGRLALRLNTTHTIADLYALVSTADNESGSTRDFVLLTPFPRKEFAKDDTTTVETAGLLKGVVQQKYL
ncbi:protein phosphatase regulator [Savitreella phatthalungensis]